MRRAAPLPAVIAYAAAVLAPVALTGLLIALFPGNNRDYVFLYIGIVATLGVASGFGPALVGALASFLCVDFYFVRPVHTLQFADPVDLVNLCVFVGAAALVGSFGSRRRAAQLRAEGLARELQEANIELARLAETERQVRALEETDRLRREVLANVSHELRTPLASILTGVTTLQRRPAPAGDLSEELDRLAAEARRLDRLVGELIEMTRIEGGIVETRIDDVDLREAVEVAADRLRRESPSRPVEIDVADGVPEVRADWTKLGQVLDNLLENADHAAPPGTPITVSAGRGPEGAVTVHVRDRGPGIPPDLRERVFDRFVRGPAEEAGGHPGMGLGLPIARGLVQAQGGTLRVDDGGAPGCTMVLTLPASTAEEDG